MATFDPTNLTWTLKTEPDENNDASVEFGCNGSTQTIYIPDVSSVDAVTAFLNQYTLDYITGLQSEDQVTQNAPGLSSLVNQPQVAPTPTDPES